MMNAERRAVFLSLGAVALATAATPTGIQLAERKLRVPRFKGTSRVGSPATNAVNILNRICDVVGIRKNITLLAAHIRPSQKTAAFAAMRDGRRYIVYDRDAVPWPENNLSWKSVKVMAHEVGHHLGTHIYNREYSGHEQELEADRFAGFAMSRMGATLDQATSWFSWDWPATPSHPSARNRRAAVREGWLLGEDMKRREGSQNVRTVTQTRYVKEPCSREFVGAELQIGGRTCRIVKTCNGSDNGVRLACQDLRGNWVWQ